MHIVPGISVFFLFLILFGCSSSPEDSTTLSQEEALLKGEGLAKAYCSSCHMTPEPELLDKTTWQEYVLPRMGYMLGVYPSDTIRRTLIEQGEGGVEMERAKVYPIEQLIQDDDWEAIKTYYLASSPDRLKSPLESFQDSLTQFTQIIPAFRLSPPSVTLVNMDRGRLYVGDANTQSLYQLTADLQIPQSANVLEGAVWLDETPEVIRLLVMGSFSPTDSRKGFLMELPKDGQSAPRVIIEGLKRPVHFDVGDLNQDGLEDIVVCEFAKWTGGLTWWENQGNGLYKRHELRNVTGAIKSYIHDFNQDGLPDVAALFGQGDEGIFILYNEGEGKFRETAAVRFPATYGSSFFSLFDFNQDGYMDFLYTCGDNADYPPVMKPYHGIRILENDGNNNFAEVFFQHLNGAYGAVPEDFDGDGDVDLAAISFFPDFQNTPEQGFVYLENQGDFKFTASLMPNPTAGRWIVMDGGDLDQDGDTDLVLGSLAFEVVPPTGLVSKWVETGIPFVILENQQNP